MGPLLFLLLLFAPVDAGINPSLKRLCLSPLVDSPRKEDDFYKRIVSDGCEQTYPYPGTKAQHEQFCGYQLPFDSKVKKRTKDEVTCRWTSSSGCAKPYHRLIFNKCYHVGNCKAEGLQIAKPTEPDEIRWISIIYGDLYQALHVEHSKAFADKLKDGYFYDGVLAKHSGVQKYRKALVVSRMSAFGLYPGDFVKTIDPGVLTLCSGWTIVTDAVSSNVALETYIKYALPGGGHMFPTRNLYQAQLSKKGEVNLNYFHNVCEGICQGCFAATYESFEKHRNVLPNGRFWVPVARTKKVGTHLKDESCKQGVDRASVKLFKAKISTSKFSSPHIPSASQWSSSQGHPTVGCSDGERLAVQIVKVENILTYVDVPVFDYQPVMCVSGAKLPAAKETGKCYRNSEPFENGCTCKDGFQDALEIKELRGKVEGMGFKLPGHICVKPKACKNVTKSETGYNAVSFLVDSSGSINKTNYEKGKAFVTTIGSHIPNLMPVFIASYNNDYTSEIVDWIQTVKPDGFMNNTFIRTGRWNEGFTFGQLDPGWTMNEYALMVNKSITPPMGMTYTYKYMLSMIEKTKHIKGKKLMILITDGEAADKGYQEKAARRSRINDYEVVIIAVGVGAETFQDWLNERIPAKVFPLEGYNDLATTFVKTITDMICEAFPIDVLDRATELE